MLFYNIFSRKLTLFHADNNDFPRQMASFKYHTPSLSYCRFETLTTFQHTSSMLAFAYLRKLLTTQLFAFSDRSPVTNSIGATVAGLSIYCTKHSSLR